MPSPETLVTHAELTEALQRLVKNMSEFIEMTIARQVNEYIDKRIDAPGLKLMQLIKDVARMEEK